MADQQATGVEGNDGTSGGSQPQSSPTVPSAASQQAKPVNPRLIAMLKKQDDLTLKLQALEAELAVQVQECRAPFGLQKSSNAAQAEDSKQTIAKAEAIVKDHIAALHDYNEIKDVGLGLMGMVAEQRGVRQVVIMDEFGVTTKD